MSSLSSNEALAKPCENRAGFTIVELLAVIMIMAILGGIILGIAGYASRRAAEANAQATLQQLRNALEDYRLQYGQYPPIEVDRIRNPSDPQMVYQLAGGGIRTVAETNGVWQVRVVGPQFLWETLHGFNPELDRSTREEDPPKDPYEDPWGNVYVYHRTGRFSYELFSWGENGIQFDISPTDRNRNLTIE